MSGISSVGNSSVSEMWQMHLKNGNTDGDSKISKAEFTAETAKMQKNKGGPAVNTDEMFAKIDTNSDRNIDESEFKASASKIDTNSDGNIDESEFKASVSKMDNKAAGAGSPPSGGQPPAGGAKGDGGGGIKAESNEVYDKKDTNKDGVVDTMEALAYALEHPEEKTDATSNDSRASGYTKQGTATNVSNTGTQQLDVAV